MAKGQVQVQFVKGTVVLLSEQDFAMFKKYTWHIERARHTCYLRTRIGRRWPRFHQLILRRGPGKVIDHIDGNGLNNARSNLRVCSRAQNQQGAARARKWSEYVGVSFHKARNKWTASIQFRGKKHYLGVYDSQRAAALAYDVKADQLYGRYAKKNFKNFVVKDLAKKWILSKRNRMFSALVIKRSNNEYREIVGRVISDAKVRAIKFEPYSKNLIPIWDVVKRGYRFLNFDGILLLTIEGETWRIF